ncbi:MAG: nucleotidyltransferase domain-containing protein [Myxococcales bacterium]|nr:nucleotidyltransferase domain-containing protein [Myxococcales bacterium]
MGSDEGIAWHRLTDAERQRLEAVAPLVFARHDWVRAAWLFGSAAKGDRPSRDIDIAVLARPVPRWGEPIRVGHALADATGITAVPFDVRLVNGASPVFLNQVLSARRLLYQADGRERIDFEARAMSAWLDFKPIYERLRSGAFDRWTR